MRAKGWMPPSWRVLRKGDGGAGQRGSARLHRRSSGGGAQEGEDGTTAGAGLGSGRPDGGGAGGGRRRCRAPWRWAEAVLRQVAALGSGSRRAPGGLAQEVAESRACARGQPRHSLALPALELRPWFTKPVGPVKPVRPGFGLGRYQTGPNSKFKFEFKKMKNS